VGAGLAGWLAGSFSLTSGAPSKYTSLACETGATEAIGITEITGLTEVTGGTEVFELT